MAVNTVKLGLSTSRRIHTKENTGVQAKNLIKISEI